MKRYRNIGLHSDLVDSLEPPEPIFEEEVVKETDEDMENDAAMTDETDALFMSEEVDEEIFAEEEELIPLDE